MKLNQFVRIVGIFSLCTTIFQLASAADHGRRELRAQGKGVRVAQGRTARSRTVSEGAASGGSTRTTLGRHKQGWLADTQSIATPVPGAGKFLLRAHLQGNSMSGRLTSGNAPQKYDIDIRNNTFGINLGALYGVTDAVFVAGTFRHLPGTGDSESTGPNYKSVQTMKDEGRREPELSIGASGKPDAHTRVIGELTMGVPLGSARSKTVSAGPLSNATVDSTKNGLAGGGYIAPRMAVVRDLGDTKLLGSLSYKFLSERKEERESATNNTHTINGGNELGLVAGIELPRAANLGFSATYTRAEKSTTRNSNTGEEYTNSEGAQMAGLIAYAGIEIPGSNVMLMPAAAYQRILDGNMGPNIEINRIENFTLSLQGLVSF